MNFRKLLHPCGLLLLLAAMLSSCHGMWDDVGQDCTTHKRIRFTYDWNMLFADAFAHEVKTLTLYAFAPDGTLAYERRVSADSVVAQGYMNVDDLPSGTYRLQVWAEGEGRHAGSYTFGAPGSGADARLGLTATVNADGAASQAVPGIMRGKSVGHDINALYYGSLGSADFTDMPLGGVREATVNLMKDTELFRIVLQNQNGETLSPADFRFYVTDDNGSLDADNNVVLTGDSLVYSAWSVTNGEAGVSGATGETITGLSAVVAELTTNRMIEGHDMRLHVVRASDNAEIINLPLVDLCLMVKGNYNHAMSNQEYLDRQDTWDLIFFLDNSRNWLSASIYVQSWRVVLQNVDL